MTVLDKTHVAEPLHDLDLVVNLTTHLAIFDESTLLNLLRSENFAVTFRGQLVHHCESAFTNVVDDIVVRTSVPLCAVIVGPCGRCK